MEDIKPGDLVFLTPYYEDYVFKRNPYLKISLSNRLAKLEQIIDWDSPTGKKIKEARLKSNKWDGLPLEDNKYIFSIYYWDVKGKNGEQGTIEQGQPLFSKDPETGKPFFVKVPDWIYKEIVKKCVTFDVEDKK